MAKIRVSYSDPAELEKVKRLLCPIIKSCRVSKTEKGHYKKAYIETDGSLQESASEIIGHKRML